MKKILLALCVLLLVGCNKSSSKNLTIILNGNPTTGYNWKYEIEDNIVDITEEYVTNCEEPGVSGCGGNYTYTIKGLKKGETNIKFIYKRNWEETESDLDATYKIKVDDSLDVIEVSHEGSYFK